MGTLYVVSTPIGNLEDITLRALRVLREVALIAAEDTRHTRRLLDRYEIRTPTLSYNQHNAPERTPRLLDALGRADVALVTDAGTPGLSDPGGELVSAAADAGFGVVPVPGASALLALVAAGGMQAARFCYLGFLPRKGKERHELVESAARTGWPFVIYESPSRLGATLGELERLVGDRTVVVGRELTKLHEEIYRGTLGSAATHFTGRTVKGEVAVMVGQAPRRARDTMEHEREADAGLMAYRLVEEGVAPRDAARQVATQLHISSREVYNRLVKLRGDGAS